MKLTLFSDYSLRILMFAGLNEEPTFSVDDVARAYGLSRNHVAKVINFLTQRGYLSSQRGRGGGIRLGQKPEEIRVGQLLRQTENGSPLVECFDAATNTCPLIRACRLKLALSQAWTAFFDTLDGYTLADLIQKPGPLQHALQLKP
jgi:Rrf2 family nitric oxide-sensitive transcriptional repressor